jgi:hypothetical protein
MGQTNQQTFGHSFLRSGAHEKSVEVVGQQGKSKPAADD